MTDRNLDFKDIANPISDTHAFDNISSWEALLINSSLMMFKDIFDKQMSGGCDCPSDHIAEEYTFGTLTNRYLKAVGKVPIPETVLRGMFGDVVKEPLPMVFPSVEISSPEELQMFHDAILDKRTEWFEHMAKCPKGHDVMFRASLNLCEKARSICTLSSCVCQELQKDEEFLAVVCAKELLIPEQCDESLRRTKDDSD